MNLPVLPAPCASDGDEGSGCARRPSPATGHLPPAVAHLFRRSLRQGQVHPLLPLLLRYRRRGPPEDAP